MSGEKRAILTHTECSCKLRCNFGILRLSILRITSLRGRWPAADPLQTTCFVIFLRGGLVGIGFAPDPNLSALATNRVSFRETVCVRNNHAAGKATKGFMRKENAICRRPCAFCPDAK